MAETALAPRPANAPEVITSPDQYQAALTRWTGQYNVLTPFANIHGLAAQHGIVVSIARIDPNPTKGGPGEVYDGLPFLSRNEVALAKIGLRKIADCAGINTETVRTDDRTIPHYWEVKAVATYTGIDGRTVRREATCEWDLRDGSARMKGWKPDQISENRKNGLRNCETRAINAAIRECCGLKQKYSQDELARPFLAIRVAFQPDMSDPEQRRLVTEHALRGTHALYPSREPAPMAGGEILPDEPERTEPRHVGSGTAAPVETAAAAAPDPGSGITAQGSSAADPDAKPTEYAVRIAKVETVTGTKNGKPWTRFDVIDANGAQASTFDTKLRDRAQAALDAQEWVEISTETRGQFTNLVEIVRAGSEPTLPGMEKL